MDQKERLMNAADTIATLSADEYPELVSYFKRTKGRYCLVMLIYTMHSYEKPMHTTRGGKAYYAISHRYLINKYGGSPNTWHSALLFLAAIGLIERIRPSENSRVRPIKSLYEKGRQTKLPPELVYSIPEYTPAVLQKAEEGVALWKSKGVSPTNITKLSLVAVYGKEKADKISITIHRPGYLNKEAIREMTFRIWKTVEARGYTTKEEILTMTAWRITGKTKYQIEHIWKQMHGSILREAGASYHRPTKEQKKQYRLVDDGWIITGIGEKSAKPKKEN